MLWNRLAARYCLPKPFFFFFQELVFMFDVIVMLTFSQRQNFFFLHASGETWPSIERMNEGDQFIGPVVLNAPVIYVNI